MVVWQLRCSCELNRIIDEDRTLYIFIKLRLPFRGTLTVWGRELGLAYFDLALHLAFPRFLHTQVLPVLSLLPMLPHLPCPLDSAHCPLDSAHCPLDSAHAHAHARRKMMKMSAPFSDC